MIGEIVGSYRITAKIGEGGMGIVYLAEHPLIGRKAAVKMLLPELCANVDIVGRFFNEARSTTMLRHPGVVDIFDFGHHANGWAYIIMEFLEGSSLGACIRRHGRLPLAMILDVTRQVAVTLAAAHAHGIVHRDLKPDNIFLVPDAALRGGIRAKLLDFGVAKLLGEAPVTKTRTGLFVGTPTYGSPEQCRGHGEVDQRSDIYSLGCVVYQLLAGRPPFVGKGTGELIAAHLHVQPAPLGEHAPVWLDRLVQRMLAKDPAQRPSMVEIAAQLEGASGAPAAAGLALVTAAGSPPSGTESTVAEHAAPVSSLAATMLGAPPVVPPPQPSPFPSVAQALPPSPRARASRWRWVALALVPMLAVVALAAWTRLGPIRSAPPLKVPTLTMPPPAPAPAPTPTPTPTPMEPAPPSTVTLTIESRPSGALVLRDDDHVRLGRTPLVHTAPRDGGRAGFVLRLAGFRDARLSFPTDRDGSQRITLTRE
jgi:serine/threonine-protein kinase